MQDTRAALTRPGVQLRFLLPSAALISAAAIGYEVLLMRLLSIIHWHHFAYMIISLALLGYGVSGTLIALAGPRLQRRFAVSYAASALACCIVIDWSGWWLCSSAATSASL